MRLGLIRLLAAMLMTGAMPATSYAQGGDTWYRAALVRHGVEPPYRTQLDESIYARSDCGPAVLGMALAAYGVDMDTLDLRRLTHTYQGTWPAVRVGTALQYMAHEGPEGEGVQPSPPPCSRGRGGLSFGPMHQQQQPRIVVLDDWTGFWAGQAAVERLRERGEVFIHTTPAADEYELIEAVIKYLDGDMSGVVNPAALERGRER